MGKKSNAKFIRKNSRISLNGVNLVDLIEKTKKIRLPIFTSSGHVTLNSISERREFFLGKSVNKIKNILKRYGY